MSQSSLRERFESFVSRDPDGHWYWTGCISDNGYGQIGVGTGIMHAHVVAWQLFRGPIPAGLEPDHTCRIRHCINPDHLELVTHAENCRRGARAKLSHADVQEIRVLYVVGLSQTTIAEMFGINSGHVSRIIHGQRWGSEIKPRRRIRSINPFIAKALRDAQTQEAA